MDSKLTLRLDKEVIERIKIYAVQHHQSVSALTEEFYKKVLIKTEEENEIRSPIARKYKGILGKEEIDVDAVKLEYLKEKHFQ